MQRFSKIPAGMAMALAVILTAATTAEAASVADFYKGKRVRLTISSSAGGGYDFIARLVARHIGRHIPGNPTIVSQNLPGAGGVRMANYFYNKAPRDGSIFGATQRGVPFEPLLGTRKTKYDPLKFTWIGSGAKAVSVTIAWHTAKVKKFSDLKNHQLVVGATPSDMETFVVAYKNLVGSNMKVVSGYLGASEIWLAMERGEVDGQAAQTWATLHSRKPGWLKDKKIYPILQFALEKHRELPNVPLVMDLAKTDDDRKAMALIFGRQTIARPFFAPPNLPKDRAQALQAAFMATMNDAKFKAEAAQAKVTLSPMNAEEVAALVKRLFGTPKPIIERARWAVSNRNFVAKVKLKVLQGTITKIRTKGRRMRIQVKDASGKMVSAKVHGRRTKIRIGGNKAKRKDLKAGLNCKISYIGPGSTAAKINCK